MGEISIGTRIKMARVKRQITQSQLSARAEISQPYLSQIEQGERDPSPEVVDMLGRAMGCDLTIEEW